jgi:sugar-specific transcriptional regulator TrmB
LEHQFSDMRVLMDLGLTLVQAKVYLALVKSGSSKTSTISKGSKVAQPDIYKTISKLQKLGLVEKIVKTPLEYRAISMRKGLSLLLETKTRQYEKIRAETRLLSNLAKEKETNKKKNIEAPQYVLIPKGRIAIERINTAIAQANISMDLVLSWKRFSRGIVSTFAESMEVAWARKVKVRFIVESPLKSKTAKQLVKFCKGKPCSQMKLIPHCPAAVLGIYDKKETFIITNPKTDLHRSPALWTNNSSIIALAQEYFEKKWLTAIDKIV